MLRRYGLSTQEALIIYGVLNGMSLPFILFPTAVINALAVLVLPTVSEAQAVNNDRLIAKTTQISIKYSLIIGIISTGLFIIFGNDLGITIFDNKASGAYLVILAWLCPLIYLTTTLGSIINGLGKTHITFVNSVIGTVCKIFFIIVLIPMRGINGYLIALLIGQLIITALDGFSVVKYVKFSLDSMNSITKPTLVTVFCCIIFNSGYEYAKKVTHINEVVLVLTFCFLLCITSMIVLTIIGSVNRKDFR